MRNLSQFVLVGLFTSSGLVVQPASATTSTSTKDLYGATVQDGTNKITVSTDNPDPKATTINGKPAPLRKLGGPMADEIAADKKAGSVVPGQPGEPGKADGTAGKGGAGGVSTTGEPKKVRTQAESEKANKAAIKIAEGEKDPNVQKLLAELKKEKGDKLYKSNDSVNKLRVAIQAARTSRKAGIKGTIKEASANDTAKEQLDKDGNATEAGLCNGPDCPLNKNKEREAIPERQVDPLRDIARREPPPPLPPEPPPLLPPPPPVVPVPVRAGPAFGGINQDMLLGGVFGLVAGVLLTKILSGNQNQNRGGLYPQMGQPMPYGMGGRFPGQYGNGFAGGYGGRFPPGIAGPAFGGGLGAPAILPMPGPGNIYNGGYQQSALGYGATPVSQSPLLVGGAPAVIRAG